jgi:hypothetical protein
MSADPVSSEMDWPLLCALLEAEPLHEGRQRENILVFTGFREI